jgi:formylmethanofuran dehydrogenase subunit E
MRTLLDIFRNEIEKEENIIEKIIDKMESQKHLDRCLDIMKADANLSEETKIIMFVEYARLVFDEKKPKNIQIICQRCGNVNNRKM